MKHYGLIARSFIALLFVVAGLQKLGINVFAPSTIITALGNMGATFTSTAGFVGTLGVPMAAIATAIVIIVEVPVAIAFAYGYRICMTGGALIAFTLLATILVHRDFNNGMNVIMALKNLSIIGGIMLAVHGCNCGTCPISKKK
jgi:putative oxidoreductase